jgi:hypothetical protein
MKKVIEIKPLQLMAIVPEAGFYDYCGSLYVAATPNTTPMYVGVLSTLPLQEFIECVQPAGGNVSEGALLRAIAIAQRPELAAQLV